MTSLCCAAAATTVGSPDSRLRGVHHDPQIIEVILRVMVQKVINEKNVLIILLLLDLAGTYATQEYHLRLERLLHRPGKTFT